MAMATPTVVDRTGRMDTQSSASAECRLRREYGNGPRPSAAARGGTAAQACPSPTGLVDATSSSSWCPGQRPVKDVTSSGSGGRCPAPARKIIVDSHRLHRRPPYPRRCRGPGAQFWPRRSGGNRSVREAGKATVDASGPREAFASLSRCRPSGDWCHLSGEGEVAGSSRSRTTYSSAWSSSTRRNHVSPSAPASRAPRS